jgi:hypothetical protein
MQPGSRRALIEEAKAVLADIPILRSDNDFSAPPEDTFKEAAGAPVYPTKQKSRPFYFGVRYHPLFLGVGIPVVLFNAAVNFTTSNYGNLIGINVFSLYPKMTYGGLLSVTINQPFRIERFRIQCATPGAIQQPFNFTETQYIGESNSVSYVPNIALDQIFLNSVSFPCDEIIDSTKQVSFLLYGNAPMSFKIFPTYISDYARVMERKAIVEEFKKSYPFLSPIK